MIRSEMKGSCLVLTLDRPDKANALTAEMLMSLKQEITSAKANAVILTGAGSVFSAGADLDAAKAGLATSPLWEELSEAIVEFGGVTIAALNGTLAGGAFGMALACDLRIAVPTAKFFYPVMKLGFLPQPSDPPRLRQIAGLSAANRILLASEKFDATEALRVGLIDEVVSPERLLDRAMELSDAACAAKSDHVSSIKSMIRL